MEKTVTRNPTGLIANLPLGTHCCNFYQAKTRSIENAEFLFA